MWRHAHHSSLFRELFFIAILLKGIFGIIEVMIGIFVLAINRAIVADFLLYLVHGELTEDPADPFALYISELSRNLSVHTEIFVGIYFFAYGIIKIFLVAGLLKEKIWAYRTALILLSLFIFYMGYRFTYTHSLPLLLLIVIDATTVILIWRGYGLLKTRSADRALAS